MTRLDHEALEQIALGATVLGTGGGGDPTLGKLMAQQAVARHGPIQLLPLDEVPDDAWIIPTAMMGAPTVLVEKTLLARRCWTPFACWSAGCSAAR